MAVDSAGNVYVADTGNHRIQAFGYLPTLTTPTATGIADTTATLAGAVTSAGTRPVTERGVGYAPTATNPDPTIGGTGVSQRAAPTGGSGTFTVLVSGLTPGTAYSFAAYATNSVGTSYSTATFTTAVTPPPGPGGEARADLVVSQTAAPLHGAKVGGTVTFRVKVTNTGPDGATGVHLTVMLSGVGVTVRTEGRCGPPAGSTVSCDLGTLPNHASRVVTITAKPTSACPLPSTATVTSSSTDLTPGDNTAPTPVTITGR